MTTRKGRLAAIISGAASLAFVGAALAAEPADPELDDVIVTAGPCEETEETTTTTLEETTTTTVEETTTTVDETTTTTVSDTTEPTVDDVTDAECDEADVEPEPEDEEQPEVEAVEEVEALEGERPQNHGFYVSEATRTCPASGAERGACISAVAQSDIGKPEQSTSHDDADTNDDGAGSSTPAPKDERGAAGKRGNGSGGS